MRTIALQLSVAKSSVSLWVRDVPMPPDASVWRAGGKLRRTIPRPADAGAVQRVLVWRSGEAKRCGRCGHTLPVEAFNRLGVGRQHYCRECFRRYHRAHRDEQRKLTDARTRARAAVARTHVLDVLSERPCADCGAGDPVVLEFDHVGKKREHLSVMVCRGNSLTHIAEEIARCDVVCVNCHRRRTARRAGWRRASARWRDDVAALERPVARNVAFAYEHLERSGCADCRSTDLVILDFDHVGIKRFRVMRAAWEGCSLRRLEEEIAECQVRCGNCHRRRTATSRNYYRAMPQEGQQAAAGL